MYLKATFFETTLSVDDCESYVLDAIGNAPDITFDGMNETRASDIGNVRNIKVYAKITDDPSPDDDRSVKGRLNEFLMGRVDCRIHILDNDE